MGETGATSANTVRIGVDGSSLGNPGAGGWSWWAGPELWESGGTPGPVSNNAMELTALHRALEYNPEAHLLILSDSNYAVNAVLRWHFGWRKRNWNTADGKPVANRELIETVLDLMAQRQRRGWKDTIEWVKGHNGNLANENADRLAREAALQARSQGQSIRIRSSHA